MGLRAAPHPPACYTFQHPHPLPLYTPLSVGVRALPADQRIVTRNAKEAFH
jgi:hypothetical protein